MQDKGLKHEKHTTQFTRWLLTKLRNLKSESSLEIVYLYQQLSCDQLTSAGCFARRYGNSNTGLGTPLLSTQRSSSNYVVLDLGSWRSIIQELQVTVLHGLHLCIWFQLPHPGSLHISVLLFLIVSNVRRCRPVQHLHQ